MDDTKKFGKQSREITRRGFLRAAWNVLLGGGLFSLGIGNYSRFERGWIKINRETFRIKGLPSSFSGVTIAHISDLHFNSWMTPERFSTVVTLVNDEMPDIVMITGDFIDKRIGIVNQSEYSELLSQLTARLDKFAVFGNHDHWVDVDVVREMLAFSGIKDASNKVFQMSNDLESISICGLDSYMEGKQKLGKVLSEIPAAQTAILMIHEPDFADVSARTGRFALQLSGHSHGGQVDIPFLGPPVTPAYGRKYPRGRYQIGDMYLYTNPGIGMIQPFIRLNCRPEVTMVTLELG